MKDLWDTQADKLESAMLVNAAELMRHFLRTATPAEIEAVVGDAIPSSENTRHSVVAHLNTRLQARSGVRAQWLIEASPREMRFAKLTRSVMLASLLALFSLAAIGVGALWLAADHMNQQMAHFIFFCAFTGAACGLCLIGPGFISRYQVARKATIAAGQVVP